MTRPKGVPKVTMAPTRFPNPLREYVWHTPPTSTPGNRSKRRNAVTPPQSERYNGRRNGPHTGESARKVPHPLTAATASPLTGGTP